MLSLVTKKAKQRKHVRQRAEERYKLYLTRKDIQCIINKIRSSSPEAKFIKRQSNRVTLWNVTFNDKELRVVYDKNRSNIVTVLPPKQTKLKVEEIEMKPSIAKRVNELTSAWIEGHITKNEMIKYVNFWLQINTVKIK